MPPAIAPFHIVITPGNLADEAQRKAAWKLYVDGNGVKFKDGDLIGIPTRLTIGTKPEQGPVESVNRCARTTTEIPFNSLAV